MTAAPRAQRLGARAEETRARILSAAEALFAERGYADTRLEDVGQRVGVKRAALFYYFRDKRELYEEVLRDVFGGLLRQVFETLADASRSLPQAVEGAVSTWVEYVWARPATAQLLLREAVSREEHSQAFRELVPPAIELIESLFAEGERSGAFRPATRNPFHFVSTITGGTLFFVAAVPALVPDLPFDPLSPEQQEKHRRDVLAVVRRLLGLAEDPARP